MTLSWSDPESTESSWGSSEESESGVVARGGAESSMGRLHAWGLGVTVGWMDRIYGFRKRELFASLPETVVEIGPGPGTNLRYYRPGTRLIAVEPAEGVHARLRREARRRGIELDLHASGAERLALDDASVDVVVSTLVLCSVDDPREVLSEVRRVLRPGGRFLFIEHVAADPGSRLHRVQGWLRRPWAWALDGCEIRRNTGAIIRAAGFSEVDEDRFSVSGSWMPVSPHVIGVARR